MKKCESCGKSHNGEYGSGRFCDQSCARSFATKLNRKEINDKVSKKLKQKSPWNKGLNAQQDDRIKEQSERHRKTIQKRWDGVPFEQLKHDGRRSRIIKEQKGKCARCGISNWQGQSLPLEIDHIDGNGSNNQRNNLEALCPNCHSLTKTWRGRNKKSKNRESVSDEQLQQALLDNKKNIRKALLAVGLAPKGTNYKRAYQLLSNTQS